MKIVNSKPWYIFWVIFDIAGVAFSLYTGNVGNAMLCALSCAVIIFCYKLTKDLRFFQFYPLTRSS